MPKIIVYGARSVIQVRLKISNRANSVVLKSPSGATNCIWPIARRRAPCSFNTKTCIPRLGDFFFSEKKNYSNAIACVARRTLLNIILFFCLLLLSCGRKLNSANSHLTHVHENTNYTQQCYETVYLITIISVRGRVIILSYNCCETNPRERNVNLILIQYIKIRENIIHRTRQSKK